MFGGEREGRWVILSPRAGKVGVVWCDMIDGRDTLFRTHLQVGLATWYFKRYYGTFSCPKYSLNVKKQKFPHSISYDPPSICPCVPQKADGPVTTDALLARVFSLATHPDKNRRLGGLMAFNQLCRPLREETSLVDRLVLEPSGGFISPSPRPNTFLYTN